MVLNIFATVFVIGIAFAQSLFGVYSGMLNCFCSIVALAVAFGFQEPLNNLVTGSFHLHSSYTEPFALVVPFVLTLLILRVLSDNLLRGNVRVPRWLDWGGGAACGFVNAQIAVGVMVIGFLMLPWGGRTLGYQRYERDPENTLDTDTDRVIFLQNRLWFRSDEFAAGLFNVLSNGSLRGSTTFASVYPDFADWVFWTGNQVQRESLASAARDERLDGFEKGLNIETWWYPKTAPPADVVRYRKLPPTVDNQKPPYSPMALKVDAGKRLLAVRMALTEASADRDKETSAQRFRPTMIRVVGDVETAGTSEPRQYVPVMIGGADASIGDNLRIVDPDSNFSGSPQMRIDAYFLIDESFKPRFVEYRRHARAALAPAQRKDVGPTDRLSTTSGAQATTPDKSSGVARFIDTVLRDRSGDSDRFPVTAAANKLISTDIELTDNQFVSGRIEGMVGDLGGTVPGAPQVEKFKVPEGRRILQIQVHTRKMESLLGQALNFAAAVANQYKAIDREGSPHDLAGYYAITDREGGKFIELFFTPTPADTGYSGLLDFKDSNVRKELREQEDAVLGLIFVLPPGKCIVSIQSQGGKIEFGQGQEMCVGGG